MAEMFLWPAVADEPAPEAIEAPSFLGDPAAFAASLGPELTRLFGLRTTIKPKKRRGAASEGETTESPAAAASMLVATIVGAGGAGGAGGGNSAGAHGDILLLAPPRDILQLMDLLYGGEQEGDGAATLALPPASASWMTLANFLAASVVRALQGMAAGAPGSAAGSGPAGAGRAGAYRQFAAKVPLRPASPHSAAANGETMAFEADFDGIKIGFALRSGDEDQDRPAEAPRPLWSAAARNAAFSLRLPVSLRIAEWPFPVGELASLGVGSILPLERPETVEILVGRKPYARLPASRLSSVSSIRESDQ